MGHYSNHHRHLLKPPHLGQEIPQDKIVTRFSKFRSFPWTFKTTSKTQGRRCYIIATKKSTFTFDKYFLQSYKTTIVVYIYYSRWPGLCGRSPDDQNSKHEYWIESHVVCLINICVAVLRKKSKRNKAHNCPAISKTYQSQKHVSYQRSCRRFKSWYPLKSSARLIFIQLTMLTSEHQPYLGPFFC